MGLITGKYADRLQGQSRHVEQASFRSRSGLQTRPLLNSSERGWRFR